MQNIEDKLTQMQLMVRQFIMSRPACSIMVDMGGGKTITTLSALTWITPPGTHILVVAPKAIAMNTWTSEIEHWNIPVNAVSLVLNDNGKDLSRAKRHARYQKLKDGGYPPSLFIISENNFCDLVDFFDGCWPFATVVIDEAQSFKNHQAEKFIAMEKVRPFISRIIQLTGTPAPNGLVDIWAPMYLLDGGQALGSTISEFRSRYCDMVMINRDIRTFKVRAGAEVEIISRIQHLALASYNTELAMPELITEDYIIDLDEQTYAEYRELSVHQVLQAITGNLNTDDADDNDAAGTSGTATTTSLLDSITPGMILAMLDDDPNDGMELGITATTAAALRMKLIQIAAGTIYLDDLEESQRADVINSDIEVVDLAANPNAALGYRTLFKVDDRIAMNMHNDKIAALIDIINNADSPVIVAYNFRSDQAKILHLLRQAGIDVRSFDKSPAMVSAWNKGQIPVMLIHPASAGHGLNLQHGGHHFVWYTLPDSLEHYLQANARLYRPGQKHDVAIHRILAEDTKDMEQPGRLVNKQITQDTLLDALHHDPANPVNPQQRQRVIDVAAARASLRRTHKITGRHDPALDNTALIEEMIARHKARYGR